MLERDDDSKKNLPPQWRGTAWGNSSMAPATVDFWFEFGSTYSYPASMRIGALAARAGVAVRFQPFLLGPIFQAQGWNTSPFNLYPAKGRHMWRDLERICTELALPFRRPELFPQSGLLAARVALVGLNHPAGQAAWVEDFCRAVYRAEFAQGRRIDQPETIHVILSELKVDAEKTLAAAQSGEIKDKLRAQTAEAQRLDIFGAPTFITSDGEMFWGNDRLESAIAWAARRR
jgi:2-hydroxychromene-2-carboxylate isomerase